MKLETIKIKSDNADGFVVINKSDFDPKNHVLTDGVKSAPKVEAPKAAPKAKPVKRKRK